MGRTRYFVLRSINQQNIDKSVERGVWATQPHNEVKLNEAYESCDDVILIFSINGSGHFQGYARMASPVKAEQTTIWEGDARVGGAFLVDWMQRVDLPHSDTDHLRNPWNEGKPVRICRDGTEVEPGVGSELVSLIDALAERVGAPRPAGKHHPPQWLAGPPVAAAQGSGPGGPAPGAGRGGGGGGGPGEAGPPSRDMPPQGLRGPGMGPRPDFDGPRPSFGMMGGGMMPGMMGMGPMDMMAMSLMGGFGMMPFAGMGGMPGFKGGIMEDFGPGPGGFMDRGMPPRDGPAFDRGPAAFDGPRGRGPPFHDGPGPGPRGRYDGPPDMPFDPRFDGPPPMWRGGGGGGGFDGPPRGGPYGGGPPGWDRGGRPPSPRFHERFRSRSPEYWGPPHGGRGGGPPPPEFGRGPPPPQGYYGGGPPQRRDERPSILEMSYDDYVNRFERVTELKKGMGSQGEPKGGPAAAAEGTGGEGEGARGASGGTPGGGGGVHLMTEEQYLAYCERYMAKMGMPFDPDMVRQHYRRMREAAGL